MTPSSLVPAEDAISSNDELWNLSALFLAHWGEGVTLASTFVNDVIAADSLIESRTGFGGKPQRVLTETLQGFTRSDVRQLKSMLMRLGHARALIPLRPDVTELTADAAGGATTLLCDTDDRRFHAGARLVIAQPTRLLSIEQFQVLTIDTVASGQIDVTTPLTDGYVAGSRVMPLIEGNIVQSMSGTIITDNAVSLRLTIKETPGVSAIPALQAPDTTPTGFDSFESMPILDLPLSWDGMQFGVSRPGNYTRSGLADLYQLKGDRPLQTGELTFAQLSRAEVFKLIRFFESRRGRLYPWLLAPPATDLTATAIGTTSVTVTAVGPERDWDFFPHVAIVLWDGTVYVREISGVARGAGSDVITLADAIPAVLLSAVKRVATGLKARFDTDEMVENWITDQIATCKLKIHEDIAEAVTINVPDPRTGIEKPASNPGGEATPGDPPDAEVLIRLRDFCTNQLTNLCVPAATFDEATTIYNPSDGNVYTVGLSDTLTECPGSTLAGWQVLPADPEDWPSWIGSSAPTTAIISGLIDSVACPDTCATNNGTFELERTGLMAYNIRDGGVIGNISCATIDGVPYWLITVGETCAGTSNMLFRALRTGVIPPSSGWTFVEFGAIPDICDGAPALTLA